MTSPGGSPLDVARSLHALSLSVIPVPPPRIGVAPGHPGDGKVPALAWAPYQHRRPTLDELERWFRRAPMNLAVVTGAVSGVVVVDADDRDALRWCVRHLPYTGWQTKTRRGFHFWFAHPGVTVRNRARLETGTGRLAIDVRGDGGYVVAPSSQHASGAVYAFAGDWTEPREQLPVFSPGWLERTSRPAPRAPVPRPRVDRPSLDRTRRYLAALPVPEIGCGSDRDVFYAAARLVRGFNLSPADAEDALWAWCGGRPGWTREWLVRKVANALRHGQEPFGALL